LQGPGTREPPQVGTARMLKVSVPHTGNAVPGFWPKPVQTICAKPFVKKNDKSINISNFLCNIDGCKVKRLML
jgi:hypothetical protein